MEENSDYHVVREHIPERTCFFGTGLEEISSLGTPLQGRPVMTSFTWKVCLNLGGGGYPTNPICVGGRAAE